MTRTSDCDYDLLGVECTGCDNWGEMTSGDPRWDAEKFGFRFNYDSPAEDFTCLDCGSPGDDRYYRVIGYNECDDPELEDVTDKIVACFER